MVVACQCRLLSRWRSIFRASAQHANWERRIKSFCYSAGWKKLEPLWDAVIRFRRLRSLRPVLESVLSTAPDGDAPAPLLPAPPSPTS